MIYTLHTTLLVQNTVKLCVYVIAAHAFLFSILGASIAYLSYYKYVYKNSSTLREMVNIIIVLYTHDDNG